MTQTRKSISIALIAALFISMFAFLGTGVNAASYKWPVPNHKTVTAKYGQKTNNPAINWHPGIDIKAPKGAKVVASKSGTVEKVYKTGQFGTYGNTVVIKHSKKWYTLYAHLDKTCVKKGQKVTVGKKIGTVGNTGKCNGPHLHFEIAKNKYTVLKKSNRVDPLKYLKK